METVNNQFKTLHGILPNAGALISAQSPSPLLCSSAVAAKRAAILLGFYRKGDAEDPQTYVAGIASILNRYPTPVVYHVTDPRSGLPGSSKWLPTIAEVKEACEAQMRPIRDAEVRAARRAEQAISPGPTDGERKAFLAKMRATYPVMADPKSRDNRRGDPIPDYSGKPVFINPKLMETQHMKGREE